VINWVGFVPDVLVSLIPGANQLLGLSNAVRHGTMAALAGIGGRLVAFVVLVGLVVAGLGATLAASTTALTVINAPFPHPGRAPHAPNGPPAAKVTAANRSPMRRWVAASGWSSSGRGSSPASASP
jgi:hypothetical protein